MSRNQFYHCKLETTFQDCLTWYAIGGSGVQAKPTISIKAKLVNEKWVLEPYIDIHNSQVVGEGDVQGQGLWRMKQIRSVRDPPEISPLSARYRLRWNPFNGCWGTGWNLIRRRKQAAWTEPESSELFKKAHSSFPNDAPSQGTFFMALQQWKKDFQFWVQFCHQSWDSNPGRLDGKHKLDLCALPSRQKKGVNSSRRSTSWRATEISYTPGKKSHWVQQTPNSQLKTKPSKNTAAVISL